MKDTPARARAPRLTPRLPNEAGLRRLTLEAGHGNFELLLVFWLSVPGVPLAGSRLALPGAPWAPGEGGAGLGETSPVQSLLPARFWQPPAEGMRMKSCLLLES